MELLKLEKIKDGKYLKNYELTYRNKIGLHYIKPFYFHIASSSLMYLTFIHSIIYLTIYIVNYYYKYFLYSIFFIYMILYTKKGWYI